jgi:hypothetical protein
MFILLCAYVSFIKDFQFGLFLVTKYKRKHIFEIWKSCVGVAITDKISITYALELHIAEVSIILLFNILLI